MENKVKFDLSAFKAVAKLAMAEKADGADEKIMSMCADLTYMATCNLIQEINTAFMPVHSKAAPHICAALRMVLDSYIDMLDADGKRLYESELKLLQNNTKTISIKMPEGMKKDD